MRDVSDRSERVGRVDPAETSATEATVARAATVLVVDDEPYVRSALARTLRRSVGRVLLAACAEEAERLLARHGVDVVLADQGLPGVTGLELLARCHARGLPAKRVLITGHTDGTLDPDEVSRAGVARCLSKPWDPVALRALVGALAGALAGGVDGTGEALREDEERAACARGAWLDEALRALAAADTGTAARHMACTVLAALAPGADASFYDERAEVLHVSVAGPGRPDVRLLDELDDDELASLAHARVARTPIVLGRRARRGAGTVLLAAVRRGGRSLGVLQLVSDDALLDRPELLASAAAIAQALGEVLARRAARESVAA
jgi:DNA-binding NarL/FixJ family response regulator